MSFHRRTAPIVIVAILGVAMHYYMRQWDEIGTIGSFTLHIDDLLFALTMIYCVAWARRRWRYSPLEYLNLILCGILVMNYARGTIVVGVATAGVHFRGLYALYVATALFVFLMHGRIEIHWVLDKIVLLGWGIVLLGVARLTFGLNTFLSPEFLATDPELYGLNRTLNSEAALMLGQAMLIVLSRMGSLSPGPMRRRMGATVAIFFSMLLISNQRTAIFATLAGIAGVLVTLPRRRRRVVLSFGSLGLVIAGGLVYGTWIAAAGDITAFLPRSIAMLNPAENVDDNTYEWRLEQWQAYLDFFWREPPIDQIIGLPLGTVRNVAANTNAEILQVSVHSGYVALLMDSGFVGVALFISMLVLALRKGIVLLSRGHAMDPPAHDIGLAIAILVTDAVFSYTYLVDNELALVLAIALQIIAAARGPVSQSTLLRQGSLSRRENRGPASRVRPSRYAAP